MFNAGDQLPLIPLSDVVGSAGNIDPEQMAATGVNNGVINGLTVTVSIVETAHWPAVGTNV